MKRVILLIFAFLALCGCVRQELRQQTLEDYYLPLVQQHRGGEVFELLQDGDGVWYLFSWNEVLNGPAQLEGGDVYRLDHREALMRDDGSEAYSFTAERDPEDATQLRYQVTNHSGSEIVVRQFRCLEVKLDNDWYILPFNNVTDSKLSETVAPGETFSDTQTPRFGGPLTLPAGMYRWCIGVRVDGELVYATAEFEIPEQS